jgi:hypothetical protein
VKLAFSNYGVAVGLKAAGLWQERVAKLMRFFETYCSPGRT